MKIESKLVMKDTNTLINERNLNDKGQAQKFIDAEVLRLCEPYIPLKNKKLIQSGIHNTVIGTGIVEYETPYARRHYYMPAKFTGAPKRGNYWFERMKKEGGQEKILQGVIKMTGARRV